MSPLSDLYISGPGVSTNELIQQWLIRKSWKMCSVSVPPGTGLGNTALRTEIPPVSLNLLMMLCTVDDEICKAFGI